MTKELPLPIDWSKDFCGDCIGEIRRTNCSREFIRGSYYATPCKPTLCKNCRLNFNARQP